MGAEATTSVQDLFDLKGADREAKAYAFLYAAFKRTEISANPVRDALDCLVPFIAPYTNQLAGKQVTSDGIQAFLSKSFGFDIPLYAIDQLIGALQQQGFVEYRKAVKAHFAVAHESKFDVVKSEIETEFDDIVAQLEAYADSVGFTPKPPPSGSWGEALISFLRIRTEKAGLQVVKVKGVLLDPGKIEMAVVAGFIHKLHGETGDHFSKILHIFMGVLIEEFISSVTEIGRLSLEHPVTVMYDTAVLLRQLGCSGKMLRIATEELTRYLQDLGFRICYFSGNEEEVSNIINTIVYIKDTGGELEGETAAAIADGEVSTSDLRLLQNSFPERLAVFNIFPAGQLESNALEAARYQMDERGFSDYLDVSARKLGRVYNRQNRQNDASYLGSIMRLRRGSRARDLADCGFLFVTPNKFLASSSRRYLIEQKVLGFNSFPPILALGQIATIAWLLKDQTIPPEKAGRELLTNCFAAIKPDAEWFGFFREGMEKVAGPLDEYSKLGSNALTVQAARRIAQDESFGNSAIVRQLNMAEILSRAEQEQSRLMAEQNAAILAERERANEEKAKLEQENISLAEAAKRELDESLEEAEAAKREAVNAAVAEAKAEITAQLVEDKRRTAHHRAEIAVTVIKLLCLVGLILVLSDTILHQRQSETISSTMWILTVVLAIVNVASFADLLKLPFMDRIFAVLKEFIARMLGANH